MDLGSAGAARHLVTIGDDVILEKSRDVRVDAHCLEDAFGLLLRQPENQPLSDDVLQAAQIAVANYGGPFLDGQDGDWVLQERERLHCLFVRIVFELMRAAAEQRRYEAAIELGRRILRMDALRESIQRDVMLLLLLNGQRAEAVRNYQRFVGLLRSELGIEPMPETKKLYDDMVSGDIFNCVEEYMLNYFCQRSRA